MKTQEFPFAHVGVEVSQENDFSFQLAEEEFTKNLKPLITPPGFRAARQRTLSPGDIKLRRRKLGELSWLAKVSRPNSLEGSDVYRIDDPVQTAQVWQQAAISTYAPPSHPGVTARGGCC